MDPLGHARLQFAASTSFHILLSGFWILAMNSWMHNVGELRCA